MDLGLVGLAHEQYNTGMKITTEGHVTTSMDITVKYTHEKEIQNDFKKHSYNAQLHQ